MQTATILEWVFFLAGMIASTFLRASNVVQSSQSGIESYRHFFQVQAAPMAVRALLAIAAFATTLQAQPNIGISPALLAGIAFDSTLDKALPLMASTMRKDVPPPKTEEADSTIQGR